MRKHTNDSERKTGVKASLVDGTPPLEPWSTCRVYAFFIHAGLKSVATTTVQRSSSFFVQILNSKRVLPHLDQDPLAEEMGPSWLKKDT